MNILVPVKQVPDTAELPKIDPSEVVSGNIKATQILNPWDEYAVEEALRIKESKGGKVTAISFGPAGATEGVKRAIAMGADAAVMISDDAFANSDALGTAKLIAAAAKKLGEFDLIITGKAAVDGDSQVVPVALGRTLGLPVVTYVAKIRELTDGSITVERLLEDGREIVTVPLPAVISVVKEINEPRYPTFMGIRKATRAKIPVWGAADLGIEASEVGEAGAAVKWTNLRKPPAREVKCEIIEGETVEEKVKILVDRLIAEKVI